jgi:hypothetical protein
MGLKKGDQLVFNNRTETVTKGSKDWVMGMVKTDSNEYSMDFIKRWIDFGFVKIQEKVCVTKK